MAIIRRLRDIVSTALLWGIVWSLTAVPVFLLLTRLFGSYWPVLRIARTALVTGFIGGAGAGALFASALMLAEQNRHITLLSRARLVLWGALAGSWWYVLFAVQSPWALNPIRIAPFWIAMVLTAGAGSLSALTTIWLGRKAEETGELPAATFPQVDTGTPARRHEAALPSSQSR